MRKCIAASRRLMERGQGTAIEHLMILRQASDVMLGRVDAQARARMAAVLVLVEGGRR